MKKLLYFFTCISLIVALGVMSASAEALTGSCGTNVTYTLDTETGVLTISGSGEMKNYSIYVNDRTPWYNYLTDITSVNIENGVTSIGSYAFNGCSSLTNITIPDNVTSIGRAAFSGCSALTSIAIPSGVKSISEDTFSGCKSLTSLTIPEGVTRIGGMAFAGCSSLQSLSVPDSVTSIGVYTFASSQKLYNVSNGIIYAKTTTNPYFCVEDVTDYDASSVTINQGARFIGYMAIRSSYLENITIPDSIIYSVNDFTNCTNLKNVYYTGDIASWLGIGFYIYSCNPMSSGANLYIDGELVTNVTVPSDIETINDYAFYNCKTLQSITIPSNVTSIGKDAFKNCDNFTIYGTAGSYAQTYANSNSIPFVCSIHDFSEWAEIKQPTCTESGTKQRSCACGAVETEDILATGHSLTIIDIVKLPTETENGICNKTCKNCGYVEAVSTTYVAGGTCGTNVSFVLDNLGSLVVYGSGEMKNYSNYAQKPWYNKSVTTIIIEQGVTAIGSHTFDYCSATSVNIPSSVTSIGEFAFSNTLLTSITIPDSVTNISGGAFGSNGRLENIIVDANNPKYKSIDGVLFNSDITELVACPNKKANEYSIPSSVTTIGAFAFYGSNNLTSITLPDSIVNIEEYAFSDCNKLTDAVLGNNVTSIGEYAFHNCTSLANITVSDSVEFIGKYAFENCYGLQNTVGYLGYIKTTDNPYFYVFRANSAQKSYSLNANTRFIGTRAFYYCNLEKITLPEGLKGIGDEAFKECYYLTSINIPEGVTSIENLAFYECKKLSKITIPDSVKYIGPAAFYGCSSLENTVGDLVYIKTTDNPYFLLFGTTSNSITSCTINEKTRFICAPFSSGNKLNYIVVPDSVIGVSEFTFTYFDNNDYIVCNEGSYIADYAASNNIKAHYYQHTAAKTATTSTCLEAGIANYLCNDCGFKYTEEDSALGHDYIEHEAKAPSCSETGYDAYESCSRCDYSTYSGDIPTVAHTLTILDSVIKLPTETENGICDFACENCGYVESTPTTYVAGGTCGENANFVLDNYGLLVIYGSGAMADYSSASSRPWDSYADSIAKVVVFDGVTSIGRLAFSGYSALTTVFLSDSVKTIGVTAFFNCTSLEFVKLYDVTSIGTKAFGGCSDLTIYGLAGAYEDTYASANSITFVGHAHTENEVLIAATCTENGLHTVTCTDCGRTLVDEILYAQGHDYIDHEAKAATCTEIGFDAYQTCSRCDYSTYSEIAALGHDYVNHEAKAQTCTEIGWNAYQTCSRCDYTTYEELATLGHDYIDHEAKAATCEEYGWNAYQTCARCDYTTYDEIAALGHDDEETVLTEPTPDAPGEGMYICKVCERVEFREIPFTAPAGDIDGDGVVTVKDVMISIKAVLDGTAIDGADTNGDGKMTLLDVIQILKAAIA